MIRTVKTFLSKQSIKNLHFSTSIPVSNPPFVIRNATLSDIEEIDKCNRKYLPENYPRHYFTNFLSKWSEISFVVEDKNQKFVGYILGTIEEDQFRNECLLSMRHLYPMDFKLHYIGHLSSIAVHKEYRGFGIAKKLIHKLHQSLVDSYSMDSVYLYVRPSNTTALSLYEKEFNYECIKKIPSYYSNGEDAHYMVAKNLLHIYSSKTSTLETKSSTSMNSQQLIYDDKTISDKLSQ